MITALMVATALAAAADPTGELLALENETYEALKTKDAARFGKLLADDFVYRSPGQPDADRAAFLATVATLPGTIEKIDGEGVKVAIRGDAALVTGIQRVRLRMPDGKVEQGATAFSDLFVKRGGRWVLAAAFGVEIPAK
jgi:ketosteroid isomerase-like protein